MSGYSISRVKSLRLFEIEHLFKVRDFYFASSLSKISSIWKEMFFLGQIAKMNNFVEDSCALRGRCKKMFFKGIRETPLHEVGI